MKNKPTVQARYNWGNWIADCPIHGEGIAEMVTPGRDFICSRCHPGIYAEMKIPHPQQPLRLISAPDLAMRKYERHQAENAGHVYKVVFPKQKERIEAVLRHQPLRHRNWRPGITIRDLERQNEETLKPEKRA